MYTEQDLDITRMRAALEVSGIGIWDYDPLTKDILLDSKSRELLGFNLDETVNYENLFNNVPQEDIENIILLIDAARISGSGKLLQLSFKIKNVNSTIRWLTAKGSGYFNKQQKQVYFTGTVQDISSEMNAVHEYKNSQARFLSLIQQAPVATCLFVGKDMIIEIANSIMIDYWGKGSAVTGLPLKEVLPELASQEFLKILDDVYTTGIAHTGVETPVLLNVNGKDGIYYFDFTYKPILNSQGEVYAVMNMSVDVTERVVAKQKIEESQKQIFELFEQAPAGVAVIEAENLVFSMANPFYGELVGRKPEELINKSLLEALPEIKGQGFDDLLRDVINTGNPYIANEVAVELLRNERLETIYVDLLYQPKKDNSGNVNGILVLATNVTQQKRARKKLEASESKLKSIIATAPAGMGLFVGRDLIIELPNQTFIDIVGKGWDVVGKPLREAMPELLTEGQPFLQILDDVYTTGKMFQSPGSLVKIVQNGVMTYNYYNITYTPLLDDNGDVFAILDIAIDVTDTIKAQQATKEAESALRGAIELADLATWSIDPVTMKVSYSEKMMQWFGLSGENENVEDILNLINTEDRQRVTNSLMYAFKPESGGIYDEEYTITNRINSIKRVLHAQGRVFFDDENKITAVRGTAQDITNQKELQTALETEVKARTEELRNANRELEEANHNLIHSNEELAQYAYVASHDLQEPLRKISLFSKMLKEQDAENKHQVFIDKIIGSSKRMSLLIKDLLEFSRLLNTDVRFVETDLNEIVSAVIDDFELRINETGAVINVNILPVIDAVPLQMNQVFYNLISNALKFVKQDKKPEITINVKKLNPDKTLKYINNALPFTNYYKITVSDNGIGIEQQYLKQIFDVFKRLHGRDEYYGSGIGLAICRRIIGNHSGAIFVESEVGKGTSFCIVLPEKQFVIN